MCPSPACIDGMVAKGRLARALKGAVSDEALLRVRDELTCKLR